MTIGASADQIDRPDVMTFENDFIMHRANGSISGGAMRAIRELCPAGVNSVSEDSLPQNAAATGRLFNMLIYIDNISEARETCPVIRSSSASLVGMSDIADGEAGAVACGSAASFPLAFANVGPLNRFQSQSANRNPLSP